MPTLHQTVVRRLASSPAARGAKRKRQIVRDAMIAHARAATADRGRDFRGFKRDGRRLGPGSGRTADWLDIGFAHYSVIAQTLHRDTGWSGELVRRLTRAIHRQRNLHGHANLDSFPALPEHFVLVPFQADIYRRQDRSATYLYPGDVVDHPTRQAHRWALYIEWHIARAIGEYDADQRLRRLSADSNYKVSGYLVDSICSWRAGRVGYEGCSGCESYAVHRAHPEQWDALLARAPIGGKGAEWEQVFPHEHSRRQELLDRGWWETLRLSDSIFTAQRPV